MSKRIVVLALVAWVGCGKDAPPVDHSAHRPTPSPATADHAAHAAHAAHGGVPHGHAEIAIPADRQQRIGLELAGVTRTTLGGVVRATGVVAANERREAHVHSRLMGYVRDLFVSSIGQQVSKGQALYTLYSQDLIVAQQEYLRARQFSPELAAAARERLRLWDIPDDQIRAIEAKNAPLEKVTVRSPIAGTVIEKSIVKGHFVEPDMMLYRIADLSQLWVIAEVYEYELGRIDVKGTATIRLEGRTEPLTAAIDYVYPTVDPTSRTVKVRLVVPNPRGELRPGSFATVELPVAAGELLTIPEEAVVDTGVRQVVYVAHGEDQFRPVEVEIGRRAEGRAEVRHGLAEGDRVVVSAQFLVDSESRLRAGGSAPGHGGH